LIADCWERLHRLAIWLFRGIENFFSAPICSAPRIKTAQCFVQALYFLRIDCCALLQPAGRNALPDRRLGILATKRLHSEKLPLG
jgi:hypothetical protein